MCRTITVTITAAIFVVTWCSKIQLMSHGTVNSYTEEILHCPSGANLGTLKMRHTWDSITVCWTQRYQFIINSAVDSADESRWKVQHRPAMTASSILDASREVWSADRWRWFCLSTLLSWDPAWSTASSFRAPSTKTWSCCRWSRGGPPTRVMSSETCLYHPFILSLAVH